MDIRIINTLSEISKKYNVSVKILKGRSRIGNVSMARIEGYIILKDRYNFTFTQIGEVFNRDHSNVSQLYKTHRARYDEVKLSTVAFKQVMIPLKRSSIIIELLLKEKKSIEEQLNAIKILLKYHNNDNKL